MSLDVAARLHGASIVNRYDQKDLGSDACNDVKNLRLGSIAGQNHCNLLIQLGHSTALYSLAVVMAGGLHLAGLAHIPALLGKLQQANLYADDLSVALSWRYPPLRREKAYKAPLLLMA
jgi:hypothetical protein